MRVTTKNVSSGRELISVQSEKSATPKNDDDDDNNNNNNNNNNDNNKLHFKTRPPAFGPGRVTREM